MISTFPVMPDLYSVEAAPYLYTEAAERLASDRGLENRCAGTIALFAGEPLQDGPTATAWLKAGYIVRRESAAVEELTPEQFADRLEEDLRNTVSRARQNQIYKRATRWTHSHGWGITDKEMSKFICDHKTARDRGDVERMLYIESILEDCNFHTINGHLYNGNYAEAMEAATR